MNVVVYPHAKINLGLQILEKRADAYHNIDTLFVPVPKYDVLELIESKELSINYYGRPFSLESDSIENELCIKAYRLLEKLYNIPPVSIHLHKNIPIGAGLGGGSSDASFTLKALNKLFDLGLDSEALIDLAAKLGSDCPFFINEGAQFGEGRGTILSPLSGASWLNSTLEDDPTYEIRLIETGLHISTAQAYSKINPNPNRRSVKELIQEPINTWRHSIVNDFESTVFKIYPELSRAKQELYEQGAIYASMTGSGSSLYGIFAKGK